MSSTSSSTPTLTLFLSLCISYLAYTLTAKLVPLLGPDLVAKGLGGVDMLKGHGGKRDEDLLEGRKEGDEGKELSKAEVLPEATGVIGASIYILLLSLFAPLPYLSHLLPPTLSSTSTVIDPTIFPFPHHNFATYLASLLSLLTATFLGFLDDVFDIRWRFKVPIPVIASVPLLVTYAAGHGLTDIVLPKVFGIRTLFQVESTNGVLHLGPLYYVYMSLLSTFCTNSINILAGINGVEVGQALIIALSIITNDLLYLSLDLSFSLPGGEKWIVGIGLARGSEELMERHLFSLYFMLPLVGVCGGLLRHNWYPARSFIGDTFCYFSGMAFAVVGILGHFSKTLLLFFLPQIFNFLYSLPQLAGIVPCPRHRLPRFNEKTGLLEPSFAVLKTKPTGLLRVVLEILGVINMLQLVRDTKGTITGCSNFTILNLLLVVGGPMKEESLTICMLGVQVVGSLVAFGIRYGVAGVFYDGSRR